jgi:hypothetical protein
LCVLLPACLSVTAFGFVGSILWSCSYQGSVSALFRFSIVANIWRVTVIT